MDNGGDILQLCRLCLVKDDVNIPIFEGQGDIRQIFLKISSCLPVKVSREDKLPKKICDGCSYKLDMLYEFWNTTANAEKQLLSWLGEAGMNSKMTDGTISAVAQQIKPTETFVKQEAIDPSDIHAEDNDDDKSYMFQQKFTVEEAGPSATVTSNDEEPPPKRARRTAAVKAQIAMDPESDDDDDSGEPMTKVEDESDDSDGDDHEPNYVDVPSTSADDQPGPSGVGKDGVEAPLPVIMDNTKELLEKFNIKPAFVIVPDINLDSSITIINNTAKIPQKYGEEFICITCNKTFATEKGLKIHRHRYSCGRAQFSSNKTQPTATTGRSSIKSYFKKSESPLPSPSAHKCEPCDVTFATADEAKAHDANDTCQFVCGVCGKLYNTQTAFTIHLLQHKVSVFGAAIPTEKLHKCPLCPQSFDDYIKMKLHSLMHQNEKKEAHSPNSNNSMDDETEIVCELCLDVFESKEELDEHMDFHKELNHESKVLDKEQDTESAINKEQDTESVINKEQDTESASMSETNPIGVIETSYSLADKPQSETVQENGSDVGYQVLLPNDNITKEHYACKTCDRIYLSVEEYQKHLPSGCNMVKICPVCFVTVEPNSEWYKHVTEKHRRWSTCKLCFKTFKEMNQLNEHKLTHFGHDEITCNICYKFFQTHEEFNEHLHSEHLNG